MLGQIFKVTSEEHRRDICNSWVTALSMPHLASSSMSITLSASLWPVWGLTTRYTSLQAPWLKYR
eukprot:CAMPEP_0175033760 /NCGR_PEP_ID=MMETSP0005-20121125/22204_1 /TAXON_ID=420556 /ORGANISM="Ochromonas sp., Strain CCMP1393" /LENGTH=64 /DNA_ID=CAMNT_0016294465 /DNA_START=118 /DNA_END=308 /DNA_ORIENTATION=+